MRTALALLPLLACAHTRPQEAATGPQLRVEVQFLDERGLLAPPLEVVVPLGTPVQVERDASEFSALRAVDQRLTILLAPGVAGPEGFPMRVLVRLDGEERVRVARREDPTSTMVAWGPAWSGDSAQQVGRSWEDDVTVPHGLWMDMPSPGADGGALPVPFRVHLTPM